MSESFAAGLARKSGDQTDASQTPPQLFKLASNGNAQAFQRCQRALIPLLDAYRFVGELNRDVWDFAVEIDGLRQLGMTNVDLRWLVCHGCVEHACEVTSSDDSSRKFDLKGKNNLDFGPRTCFVLTDEGAKVFSGITDNCAKLECASVVEKSGNGLATHESLTPQWDRDMQQLRVGNNVVKQFKVPAPNQELILSVFQEEGWPVHIDDPLPPHPEQDARRRLHDTINSLNRNQKISLIRFLGNGKGKGVRWELVQPNQASSLGNARH
jgi:hypothetical protein